MNKIPRLNLGSGLNYRQGYVNIDSNRDVKADIYHDLEKFPYPFKDNTFEIVYCHHILEHMENLLGVMEELWRISKPNAKIHIYGPITGSFEVECDLTHKRSLNSQTFRRCFLPKDTWSFYTKAKFQVLKDYIIFYSILKPLEFFVNKSRKIKNIWERHFAYTLQAKEIKIILKVVK
ncbi:methyltransferase domain-containing protein [Candidatus Woesearchaeota archaeon]|nr:methyltransferase domain-containing protein [Candidatus Woesearchaeota archaeon]